MATEKTPITVLGPVPPPRGGASMHVVRLVQLMRQEGHTVQVLPWAGLMSSSRTGRALGTAGQLTRIAAALPLARGHVIHFHYSHLAGLVALAPWLQTVPGRWVITLHSVKLFEDLAAASPGLKDLVLTLLRRFALAVCVRRGIEDAFVDLGVAGPETVVMPAFLPPTPDECALDQLPRDLARDLADRRLAGAVQLACAAYQLGPAYGKDDLYGVEMLAEALADPSVAGGREVILYVMVSNVPVDAAERAREAVVAAGARAPHLTVEIHVNRALVPVIAHVDAFMRPSREDGDSVAIREALAVGRPVWASDAVDRPEKCTVFPLTDPAGRQASLTAFLANLSPVGDDPAAVDPRVDTTPYRDFVARLVGGPITTG